MIFRGGTPADRKCPDIGDILRVETGIIMQFINNKRFWAEELLATALPPGDAVSSDRDSA